MLARSLSNTDIKRLHLADVVAPSWHPRAGQAVPVYAFLIAHPNGNVMVDTGIGDNAAIEKLYRPVRRSLLTALAELEVRPSDVFIVINTHLHFDHCGENRLFPNTPILVQASEYAAAHGDNYYTVFDYIDFPGAKYELLHGATTVLPGLSLIPTPGHTPGHQSVVVETQEGKVVIAAQAVETAAEFARGEPDESNLRSAYDPSQYVGSLRQIRDLAPVALHLSHDAVVWELAGGR